MNNPLNLVDLTGEMFWKPDEDALLNNNEVRFIAEEGDDLFSLSTQTGISLDVLQKHYGSINFEAGKSYSFDKIDVIKNINSTISSKNTPNYNCSNFAFEVNGINQNSAFGNGNDGYNEMSQAATLLSTIFSNIPENTTRIGDIVTFNYSENAMRQNAPHQDVSELYTPKYTDRPSHYGVVLLKSKNGNNVNTILEKPGKNAIRLNSYNNYRSFLFTPRPQTGGISPFYRKNQR